MSFINELLASNPNPAVFKGIDFLTCQWIDMKAQDVHPATIFTVDCLRALSDEKLIDLFDVSHLLRDIVYRLITALERGVIDINSTVESIVDADLFPEHSYLDQAVVEEHFGLKDLDAIVECLVKHPTVAPLFQNGVNMADGDLARLSTSVLFQEYVRPGFSITEQPRFRFVRKSMGKDVATKLTMCGYSKHIFQPVVQPATWMNLAIERGILIDGRMPA